MIAGGRYGRGPAIASLAATSLVIGGCAFSGETPPTVTVADVRLTGLGLLDEAALLTLCVTNPNSSALSFSKVHFTLDVADARLADGVNEVPVRLPPKQSTLVPFVVATTVRNVGSQLASTLGTGRAVYRISGAVAFSAFPIPIPFSKDGSLSLLNAGLTLAAAGEFPAPTACASTDVRT